MGRAVVKATDCAMFDEDQLKETFEGDEYAACADFKPKWHPFSFAPGEPTCGEILVSFCCVDVDYNYAESPTAFDLTSLINSKEHKVELLILGLRDL